MVEKDSDRGYFETAFVREFRMRYVLQVASKALPGREEEYDRWYDEIHVHDVLGVPGFLACQRYRRFTPGNEEATDFVANYEVETDNPGALLESLIAASASMQMTDAIDSASVSFEFLLPHGDRCETESA